MIALYFSVFQSLNGHISVLYIHELPFTSQFQFLILPPHYYTHIDPDVSKCFFQGCIYWRPLNLEVARWGDRWGDRWGARWGACWETCCGGPLEVALSKAHPDVRQTPGTPRSPGWPLKPGWPTWPLSPIRPGCPSNAWPGRPRLPSYIKIYIHFFFFKSAA